MACPAPASDAPDPAQPYRVHLDITHAGVIQQQEAPALIITALDDQAWSRCQFTANDHRREASWGGVWPEDLNASQLISSNEIRDLHLPPAEDTVPTTVLISGPGELRPREISCSGRSFTITCDGIITGSGNATVDASAMPRPQRELIAVSLGVLPAGAYQCQLQITWRAPTLPCATILKRSSETDGTIAFKVDDHAMTARDTLHVPEGLTDAQLFAPAHLEVASPNWVAPRRYQHILKAAQPCGLWEVAMVAPTLLGNDPVAPPPQGTDQVGGVMSAVIIGPYLNCGEALTLREIIIEDGTYRLTLETWTDDSPRLQNTPQQTLLVVPLPFTTGATRPKVVLDWHDEHAATLGGDYRERPFGGLKPRATSQPMIGHVPHARDAPTPPSAAPAAVEHPHAASSGF